MRILLIAALAGAAGSLRAASTRPGVAQKPKADQAAPVVPEKKQEELKIPGLTIVREKGGFLGLVLENNNFKLSFYNGKKEPVAADVSRAAARWPVHYSVYDERAMLTPSSDGMALTSSKFIRPPYQFKLYLTLITDESSEAPESYVIDYHQ
jgi:hypothetical protein